MGKFKNIKNKTNEEILVKNLKDVKKVFDKHNIKFWLDRGTLLGAIQQGKIFPWDKDVDLGVMGENRGKIISILPDLKEKGFFVDKILSKNPHHREFAFTRFGWLVDVFLYYPHGENYFIASSSSISRNIVLNNLWILWRLLISNKKETYIFRSQLRSRLIHKIVLLTKYCLFLFPQKLRSLFTKMIKQLLIECNYSKLVWAVIPKQYLEKFWTIEFYGEKFNIPFQAERYLEYKYGPDWKIPKKEWNRLEEDGSIAAFRNEIN